MKDLYLEDDRFVESRFSFRPKRKKGKSKKAKKKKGKALLTSAMSTNTLIGEEKRSRQNQDRAAQESGGIKGLWTCSVFRSSDISNVKFYCQHSCCFWNKINTVNFPLMRECRYFI